VNIFQRFGFAVAWGIHLAFWCVLLFIGAVVMGVMALYRRVRRW